MYSKSNLKQSLFWHTVSRRNGDSDYSDGEEDFYYSEIEVNMDTLSEGLSNLTPTSPTTIGPPPVFPLGSDTAQSKSATVIHSPLSQSAPSTLCHIRTDHAYQVTLFFFLHTLIWLWHNTYTMSIIIHFGLNLSIHLL